MFVTAIPLYLTLLFGAIKCPEVPQLFLGRNYYTFNNPLYQEHVNFDGSSAQGVYNYVDPSGQTMNVQYSAGKRSYLLTPIVVQQASEIPANFVSVPETTISAQGVQYREAPSAESLFIPAISDAYPAESAKQAESYNKALEEILQEQAKEYEEMNNLTRMQERKIFLDNLGTAQSYVNVKFGDGKYNYEYYV